MAIAEPPAICTRPFEWCEVHPDGSVFLCCPAWLKRPIGNLLSQSLEEIWNSAVAQEIRKSILNGSFHNCSRSRCPHLANRTRPVGQLSDIEDGSVLQALEKQLSRLPYLPRQLNLCFDHSCNLTCPSCRDQLKQAGGEELRQAEQISAILVDQLIPTACSITLSGFGDPFGSPTYLALLKQLNREDFPRLQQVRLHSNGQLLTPQMWEDLPALQPLIAEIEVSIDAATEQTYRLNRPGGSFTRLRRNLQFLSEQKTQLTLSMVVQRNNWREIPLLLRLAAGLQARVYLSQPVNWGTFSREEFRRRAVQLPEHPEHGELIAMLERVSRMEGVELGNLASLAG